MLFIATSNRKQIGLFSPLMFVSRCAATSCRATSRGTRVRYRMKWHPSLIRHEFGPPPWALNPRHRQVLSGTPAARQMSHSNAWRWLDSAPCCVTASALPFPQTLLQLHCLAEAITQNNHQLLRHPWRWCNLCNKGAFSRTARKIPTRTLISVLHYWSKRSPERYGKTKRVSAAFRCRGNLSSLQPCLAFAGLRTFPVLLFKNFVNKTF